MANEYLLAEWSEKPYTAHDKRHKVVHYKVVLVAYDFGADVILRRRGEPGEWVRVKTWEVRNGRVTTTERKGVFSE